MTNSAKAIVLTDGKAGHENQSKAFARALGLDFQLVPVKFKSPFHKMLSYLFDMLGIRAVGLLQGMEGLFVEPPNHQTTKPLNYQTVIGTGSGTLPAGSERMHTRTEHVSPANTDAQSCTYAGTDANPHRPAFRYSGAHNGAGQ